MKLKYSGLNVDEKNLKIFEINLHNEQRQLILSKNFYPTFDSVYYYSTTKTTTTTTNQIDCLYQLNISQSNEPLKLVFDKECEILSVSTNTDYLWILSKLTKSTKQQIELSQYSKSFKLINKISELNINDHLFKRIDDELTCIYLIATDVNIYLFTFDDNDGLKCIFELNDNKKDLEEKRVDESSTISLEINKTYLREKIKKFSSGKEHVLILTEKGRLYSYGGGCKGQLGHGIIENKYEPCLINNLKDLIDCQAGGWHSGALDINGNCFLWGWNSHGQLGFGKHLNIDSVFVPIPTQLKVENQIDIKFKRFLALFFFDFFILQLEYFYNFYDY
jgi:hypothetical protein